MSDRDLAKKQAVIDFRTAKTKEERTKIITDYLKKYVQPTVSEKAGTINPYSVFDGKVV